MKEFLKKVEKGDKMNFEQLIFGLSLGSTYALIALAITLVYRGMRIINFAQGEIFMVGAFMGYVFTVDFGLPMYLSFPLSLMSAYIFGALLERVFLRKLEKRPDENSIFLMTIALFIILRNAAQLIFGASAFSMPPIMSEVITIAGAQVHMQYIVIIITSIIIMIALYILFAKTSIGLSLRAVAQDKTTARMLGINVSKMNNITFGLCAVLGAAAGIVFAPVAVVSFEMGNLIMLKGFTAAMLGGLGIVPGAILGGFLLGIVDQFSAFTISSAYKDLISYSILLIILLVRPNGLLGKKQIDKV